MSDNQVLRAWEECVISQEKGNRILHYILRDSTGNCILAVVGIERSVNHMFYSVTEDFIRVFGSTSNIHAGTKWKARKDVVEFLASAASRGGPIFDISNQQIVERTPHLKFMMNLMTRFSQRRKPLDKVIYGPNSRKLSAQSSGIVWCGEALICRQQLKHYPALIINGTSISVHSFVWILVEESKGCLSYVEDLYMDQNGETMARVRWFLHREEVENRIPKVYPQCREVFITSDEQEISAKCIDGLASILTPSHFKKCVEILPEMLSFKSFMCYRQFSHNSVSAFSLNELHGYWAQPILHSLPPVVSQPSSNRKISTEEAEAEKVAGPWGSEILENSLAAQSDRVTRNESIHLRPQKKMRYNLGDNVERLSGDSGMRGCWFRCKILHSSRKHLRVQYYDLDDVDGPGKLEEWIPAHTFASPDKLGIRFAGRWTVRPWPDWDQSIIQHVVGTAIDAWWCNGWWEGVIVSRDTLAERNLRVYLPGENQLISVERKDIRVSKDWADNRWININPNPDLILSCLSTSLNAASPKLLPSLPAAANSNACSGGIKKGVPCASTSKDKKAVEDLHLKATLIVKENEE